MAPGSGTSAGWRNCRSCGQVVKSLGASGGYDLILDQLCKTAADSGMCAARAKARDNVRDESRRPWRNVPEEAAVQSEEQD